jgi:tetratricopeptide (TPR) repeat protein
MQRKIGRGLGVLAVLCTLSSGASAQLQGGANWDNSARDFGSSTIGGSTGGSLPGGTAAARNSSLDTLNKILSASQLPAFDRSLYLSIRAFHLTRLGRDKDSEKDIVEMVKVLPNGWQIVLSTTQSDLAGGGDRAAALKVLDYGLAKKPNDAWLVVGQAQVYMQIADYARALGVLDQSINGNGPADKRLVQFYRGHANFNLGNFQQSASDFEASLEGRTTLKSRLPGELWRYAANVPGKQDARAVLNRSIGNENLYEWPGPIAKFLLGKMTAGELEVAAESDPNAKRVNGKCPASFFAGMDAQRSGNKQRAREQLQLAQARCPTTSELNWAASTQLKRL